MFKIKSEDLNLTKGNVWKSIIYFAVPIMVSNVLQQLYNTIDSAVVGVFAGSEALAAIGSTGSITNLLVGVFIGIATGTGVIYAQYYGAGNIKKLSQTIDTAIVLSVIGGVLLSIIGVIVSPKLLKLMHSPEEVIGLSTLYLRIYFAGSIVMVIYNVGAGIIRAGGDSKRPLYFLLYSGVLNLILDLVLVGIFKIGVAGAAIATLISQAFSAILVIIYLSKLPKTYSLKLKTLDFRMEEAKKIIKLGIPCGLQSAMFNIANIIVQTEINSFGAIAMAGGAAYGKIDAFLYVPMNSLGLTMSTYVGQNIGAGFYERVKKGVKVSIIFAVAITILAGILVILSGSYLLNIFTNDDNVKKYGLVMMWVLAPFNWTNSFTEVLGGAIRGAGAAMQVLLITALNICIFRIIWLLVLFPNKDSIKMVYLCYPASWIVCSFFITIYYFKGDWLKIMNKARI